MPKSQDPQSHDLSSSSILQLRYIFILNQHRVLGRKKSYASLEHNFVKETTYRLTPFLIW